MLRLHMANSLATILARAETWPEEARLELERLALDIEAEIGGGEYHASASELAGIDRGLRDAADGKFASAKQVENALDKFRR